MSFRIPSTPNSRSIRTAPSTTPAGPPPSHLTTQSTTPAGPPPQVLWGSSFPATNNTFKGKNNSFEVPEDGYSERDAEGEMEEDEEDEEDFDMPSLPPQSFISSIPPRASMGPRGLKRSHNGQPRKGSDAVAILKNQLQHQKLAKLHESDHVLKETERIMADLDTKVQNQSGDVRNILTAAASQLTTLWKEESHLATQSGSVGPKSNDAFTKANYIASLLVQLHCPHSPTPGTALARNQRSATLQSRSYGSIPLPRALLEWLEIYHQPFPDDFDAIRSCDPSPSAHESFWDVVFANTLRGKLGRVVDVLKNAGWESAATAQDEDPDAEGYEGHQLQNVQTVVSHCVEVLQSCPALDNNDWDVKSLSWTAFRNRVQVALQDLDEFSGNDGQNLDESTQSNFLRSNGSLGRSLASKTRQANSKVPLAVYDNLQLLYRIVTGTADEILMVSQDWLEGSIYLTVWWDGSDEEEMSGSLNRSSIRKSNAQKPRLVDVNPLQAYRNRLRDACLAVTAQSDDDNVFKINTSEIIELSLAAVFEDKIGLVVDVLQTLTQSIAVAVAELAALDGWVQALRPKSKDRLLDQGFSREDLLVFSMDTRKKGEYDTIDRDDILSEYAERLAQKQQILDKEGWELAVAVLNRLDQTTQAQKRISELLDTITLEDEARVDKVLRVCDDFSLAEQRSAIADRFADFLASEDRSYGAALIYYARAHAVLKLKEVVVLLTSLCLLHSASMPVHKLLDEKLDSLLSKDRSALKELAQADMEAATILSSRLSGYATLRKFYDLRDQDILASQGVDIHNPLKSLERRRQAATALYAVIESAADCFTGGLYDPEVESVVSPDGVLTLLGEALPFLGQDQRIFAEDQVFGLLAVVEDFVALPSRIRENADSLLSATVTAHKEDISTASGIFNRSRSNLSASSSWDMLASQSIMKQTQSLGKDAKIQRAWDWRQGLLGLRGQNIDGEALIKLVREALVREVAKGWGGKVLW